MQTIILVLISLSSIVWSLFFLPAKFVGVKIYNIKDRSVVCLVSNRIKDYSIIVEDGDKPSGFFISLRFIGYVHSNKGASGSESSEIYILTTKRVYENLTKLESLFDDKTKQIDVYYRTGNFFWLSYCKRQLNLNIEPNPAQSKIVSEIVSCYKKSASKTVVAYIHGKPGTGKSTIPLILAQELKGSYCKTFNPTDPGDRLNDLYNLISPKLDTPMVLVIEEANIMINNIHNHRIESHKHIPVLVRNKESWNSLFDDIKLMYPYLIIVMTSNVPPEVIDDLDSSYLRKGRVDIKAEIKFC